MKNNNKKLVWIIVAIVVAFVVVAKGDVLLVSARSLLGIPVFSEGLGRHEIGVERLPGIDMASDGVVEFDGTIPSMTSKIIYLDTGRCSVHYEGVLIGYREVRPQYYKFGGSKTNGGDVLFDINNGENGNFIIDNVGDILGTAKITCIPRFNQ